MSLKNMGMITCMKQYGSSFIRRIGEALARADLTNYQKLETAFPEYFKEYTKISKAREKDREKNA